MIEEYVKLSADSPEYFLDYVRIVCAGTTEHQQSAFTLFEKYYKDVSDEERRIAMRILRSWTIISETEGEEEPFAQRCKELLK